MIDAVCRNGRSVGTLWSRRGQAVLLAGLLVLLGGGPSAMGDFRLFDDFEDETLGPIQGQDAWTSSGGDNAVVLDPAGGGSQVMQVPSASSVLRKALLAENVSVPDGTFRMMFMRMRVANKQTFSVGLSPLSYPSEYSDFAPEIGMANSAPNLDLRAWDDDGGNYEFLTRLNENVWYNVWVRVDTQLNDYSIWLTDEASAWATEADQLAAADGDDTFDFRFGQNQALLTFYIKTSGGSSGFGPVYFDDIYVTDSAHLNLCNPSAPPRGDCNRDGAFTLADLAGLDACLLGAEVAAGGDCVCLDTDCDTDVDLQDFAALQATFGP